MINEELFAVKKIMRNSFWVCEILAGSK